MPSTGGGLPRLSEVEAWDTGHLTSAATTWSATAQKWEDGFADVAKQSYLPGGSEWNGVAADAAQRRAVADRTAVNVVAEKLRAVSTAARTGATDLAAARQRVLSVVSTARAAGFEVGDDLSVTYIDDGSSAAAARRSQAESLARDLWRQAANLTETDRRVSERISGAAEDIQSLDFGPGRGDPPLEPQADAMGVRTADDVHAIVDPLPPGEQDHVRQLPTEAEIRALYGVLTENGTLATPPTYPGTSYLLDDGTRISMRETSGSGGTTIDIKYPDGEIQKVHLPPGGEQQQQPAQEPESGFWDTMGGIAIGILGGLVWVGEKATYPLR